VRNFRPGDRVVVPSTIACGYCSYCRSGYYSQCDNANPNGSDAGTAFYGGPKESGPFHGMQAEFVRVPYAAVNLVRLPEEVTDDQAIMLSDIFPTAYFGADLAEIGDGDTVAVWGCGPVGQFAVVSAKLMGAGRVFAIDRIESRLEMARAQGAEVINFEEEDPTEALKRLTGGIGVDRAIDAVGVDAETAESGPAAKEAKKQSEQFEQEREKVAPEQNPEGELWQPGRAPSQALAWAVKSLCKAGTLSVIGVYPPAMQTFPTGEAMNKNLTMRMGNCNHRRYVPMLVDLVRSGTIDPQQVLTQREPVMNALDAYKAFDTRQPGWIKVELLPGANAGKATA
jgi:threonine dehydrogenase-like Zn-dependent dehydrogenase